MAVESYTFVIAIYGAILSTVLFILKFHDYFQQNISRLKVEPGYGFIKEGLADSYESVMINTANIGKKPVTLSSGGFEFASNTEGIMVIVDHRLPKRLEEGESHVMYAPIDNIKKDLAKLPQGYQIPKYAWVKDQTGKKYTKTISKKSALYKALKKI